MMKNKKLYLEIGIWFLFVMLLIIVPVLKDVNFENVISVLFLNYTTFDNLEITVYNPRYMIVFISFFHIICFQKLSVIINNPSFISMHLHKQTKKKQFQRITKELGKDTILLLFTIFGYLLVICSTFYVMEKGFAYEKIIVLLVNLIKYCMLIFLIQLIGNILCIMKDMSYFYVKVYVIVILLIYNDISFNCHIVTLSSNIYQEIMWLTIICCITGITILMIRNQYLKIKEVYYD